MSIELINLMWFSVGYSLIDNDTCHHSGQNVVDSRGAAEWVRNKFWPLWWRVSLSIRRYTTLNHIRFFTTISKKSLSWQLKTPTRIWKCMPCIMQMSCLYVSDFSFKKFWKLNVQKRFQKNAWAKSNDAYSLSIRVHTTKNHISICFLPHNINIKENVFSERELKKALRDTLTWAAW